MNDLIHHADLGEEEANQLAEMLGLHRVGVAFVQRQPVSHLQWIDGVSTFFVDHDVSPEVYGEV